MQSVGIEPTLLRTRALSVRLNRSAKTALCLTKIQERFHGAMATRRIPDPKIGGSIPSGVSLFFDIFGSKLVKMEKITSKAGNRTRVSCVTGRNTNHYTTSEG